MFEERVDLSNDMTWRQMIAVGVRRVVLARGELDKLEGPEYAARRAELRRKAGEAARARDRQAAAASQDEADGSDATEEEATGGRTTRVGRPRGGMKVAARIGEGLRREIERGRRPRVLGWATASTTLLSLKSLCAVSCVVAACRPPIDPSLGLSLGALGVHQSLTSHPGPGSSEAHPAPDDCGIGLRAREP